MEDSSKSTKNVLILLLVLFISIGFAYLSTQLNIFGTTEIKANSWNIYFDNVQVTEGSVTANTPEIDEDKTTVNYTVTLDKPGDFYEFTIDAKNDGTLNGVIESVAISELDADVLKYLNYSVTYLDGTEIKEEDILEAKKKVTYKILIEYKKDIVASDLDENGIDLELSFTVNYVQATKKTVVQSEFIKLVKSSVLSDSSINFAQVSSDNNGKGLYVRNGTEDDDYPIYYYRGNISNNNAKFAGFCWKIVRTTETGGTKLLYNGTQNASGECTNTTGASTTIGTSTFNASTNSPAYHGYMYGKPYTYQSKSTGTSHIYGNSFTYNDGTYTLRDIHNGLDNDHHYTCFNTTDSCTQVSYVYYLNGTTAYYITLADGKSVEDAIEEMEINTTNSTIKNKIDNWFENTFLTYFTSRDKDYNAYLEDTIWCNDRSMNTIEVSVSHGTSAVNNGWKPNGGGINNYLYYSSTGRRAAGTPTLTCSNKNDSFTVTETANGNGALTYPVGLLTLDETILAGTYTQNNSQYYLYTGQVWWTMTPGFFTYLNCGVDTVHSNGVTGVQGVDNAQSVRPSISLAPSVKIREGGDGSSSTPYEFIVE